ncbi:MAG: 4-(cytidine 5'-diphospho)-2-C-methyl-D-erythritol kinase [Clostridia bacterium]|nr:4-(cytidine 5'-diphospho)-2-C-methyl-D-erythritol kinase [Clostridia bacterium]
MRLLAKAKINWSLDITGVREDGYHLMDMLMQPVELGDEVTLTPAEEMRITTGGKPLLKADERHLAMRAARLLKEETGYPGGVAIHVEKRTPVGAGMGGGSADAAAVLFGLNRMWGAGLTGAELEALGLRLGADVPFCLRGRLTRTRGIGEQMEDLPCARTFPLVVIQPCRGLSTRDVFAAFQAERMRQDLHPDTEAAARALAEGDLAALRRSLRNVLQPVSVRMRPEIGACVGRLKEAGAEVALMTGSGSAVFGVFRTPARARAAFVALATRYPTAYLTRTSARGIEIMEE